MTIRVLRLCLKKAEKIREIANKWKEDIRSRIGPKIERYHAIIETYDVDITPSDPEYGQEHGSSGWVVIEIPVVSEGLITAISLSRDVLSDK